MKKDLILITAYCNTRWKIDTLRSLVKSLKNLGNFDILITSHSSLPQDIIESVDYFFYDSKNILLTDFDLRNAVWFNPIGTGEGPIQSIFVGSYSTHLAAWRLTIFGNKIAKSLGYTKVHNFEYDTEVESVNEIIHNSELLETHDVVIYTIQDSLHHNGLLLGSFSSYRLDTLNPKLENYNEEEILNTIRETTVKTCETLYKNLLVSEKSFYEKKVKDFKIDGIKFALSKNHPESPAWCLPFYNRKNEKLSFIIWNHENFKDLNVKLIYNNKNVHNISDLNPDEWRLFDLGNYEESEELVVIVNGKVRNIYDFTKIKEEFKLYSYR